MLNYYFISICSQKRKQINHKVYNVLYQKKMHYVDDEYKKYFKNKTVAIYICVSNYFVNEKNHKL